MSETVRRRVRIGMVVAPIVLALFIAWNERTAIFPFVLGIAIAYVMAPAVGWITRAMPFRATRPHLARGLAILILYASVAGAGVGIGFLVAPGAADEIEEFSDNLPDTVENARGKLQDIYDEYVPEEHHERVDAWLEDAGDSFANWAAGITPDAVAFAGNTFTILIGYLTIPVWLYFTMKDHPRGVRAFVGMFPPEWRHDVRNSLGIADAVFRNYIRAMLLQGVIIGVMAYIALRILDVRYPIGLAIIAGITEMIPIIGPIIGAVPAVLVALAQDPLKALWVAIAFLIIQQLENNLIVPKVQGDFLRMHPGVIIVLLVVAGAVGGFILVITIVPLAAFVRDLYQYLYLRVGNVPPDEALDRALGEYGALRLRTRWKLEEVVPAESFGNRGFDVEYPLAPEPAPTAADGSDDSAGGRVVRRLRRAAAGSARAVPGPASLHDPAADRDDSREAERGGAGP